MTLADAEAAAQTLVAAFAAHDTEAYFAAFAEDASFVFHNVPGWVTSRAQYRALWQEWEAEGFAVLGCRSLDGHTTLLTDDVAVFTHRVRTRLAGESAELRERETIVLRRDPVGGWLAVHEHLSPDPADDQEEPRQLVMETP